MFEAIKQYIRRDDVDNSIVSSIDNGIVILDTDLNIFYFNKWLELHTGIKESNALGDTLDNLFPQISKVKFIIVESLNQYRWNISSAIRNIIVSVQ